MTKIRILPQVEVVKIAAGEVVRRPASAIKELVENALDAGGKNIIVRTQNAGCSLIQIMDDGVGMDAEDAKLSIVPHATSKITTLHDLTKLVTFGFRGEALASIAAVSDLEIITAQENQTHAHKLFFRTGTLETEEVIAAPTGTTITVQNLFYNLPVRRKFLKSKETENNQIRQTFINLALAHQNITFKLFEDDKMLFNAIGTPEPKERLAQLFDHHLAQNMISFSHNSKDVLLTGLTSNIHITRYNKAGILLFVNNRPFKDPKISNALCQGYAGALPSGRFPVTLLHIILDPALVDVNIHPAKEEVSFLNYGKILNSCKEAIHEALEKQADFAATLQTTPLPNVYTEKGLPHPPDEEKNSIIYTSQYDTMQPHFMGFDEQPFDLNLGQAPLEKKASLFGLDEFEPLPNYTLPQNNSDFLQPKHTQKEELSTPQTTSIAPVWKNAKIEEPLQPWFNIIGQLFNTYIVYEREEIFGLIDQHAASERILYEEMKENFTHLPTNQLLFPIICEFDQEKAFMRILELQTLLLSFGIEFDKFGKTSLAVTSLPPSFAATDLKEFFINVAEKLEFNSDAETVRKQAFEYIHAQLACKRAIKAGEQLSPAVMESLVKKLQQVANKYQCIHGRPTMYEFAKNEVTKWFRR